PCSRCRVCSRSTSLSWRSCSGPSAVADASGPGRRPRRQPAAEQEQDGARHEEADRQVRDPGYDAVEVELDSRADLLKARDRRGESAQEPLTAEDGRDGTDEAREEREQPQRLQ